jgi:hypothetical protein
LAVSLRLVLGVLGDGLNFFLVSSRDGDTLVEKSTLFAKTSFDIAASISLRFKF